VKRWDFASEAVAAVLILAALLLGYRACENKRKSDLVESCIENRNEPRDCAALLNGGAP